MDWRYAHTLQMWNVSLMNNSMLEIGPSSADGRGGEGLRFSMMALGGQNHDLVKSKSHL